MSEARIADRVPAKIELEAASRRHREPENGVT